MDYKDEQFWLMQGDCLERMKEIPDGSVDMILCDLPYGTTACKWDSVIPFAPLWEQYLRVTKQGAAIVLTASQPFTSVLVNSNLKMFKYSWVWEKNRGSNFATTKFMPMKEHEDVVVFSNGGGKTPYYPIMQERAEGGKSRANYDVNASNTGKRDVLGGMVATDLGKISEMRVPRSIQKFNTEVGQHPTQKPVTLMEYTIKTYTTEGETVLDNTMGSGTTGVACSNLSRKFIGVEMDTGYFDIAKNRILEKETNVINTGK